MQVFKVLFDFFPDESFQTGIAIEKDSYVLHFSSSKEGWAHGIGENGVGFFPVQYLDSEPTHPSAIPGKYVFSLIRSLTNIKDDELVEKTLIEAKNRLLSDLSNQSGKSQSIARRRAPPAPIASDIQRSNSTSTKTRIAPKKLTPPKKFSMIPKSSRTSAKSALADYSDSPFIDYDFLVSELITLIATETDCSNFKAASCLESLAKKLLASESLPAESLQKILCSSSYTKNNISSIFSSRIADCFLQIFTEYQDYIERNWSAHTNEGQELVLLFEKTNKYVSEYDANVVITAINAHPEIIEVLPEFFRHELDRPEMRNLILQLIISFLKLADEKHEKNLETTWLFGVILPVEIIKSIHKFLVEKNEMMDDFQTNCAICLTHLLTLPKEDKSIKLPNDVRHSLSTTFVSAIFDFIEGNHNERKLSELCAEFTTLLLILNFHMPEIISKVMSLRKSFDALAERTLGLLNQSKVQSTKEIEWFITVYQSNSSTHFVRGSNFELLTELVRKNITDLPVGNEKRTRYIELLKLMLKTTSINRFLEQKYWDDLKTVLSIASENYDDQNAVSLLEQLKLSSL